MREYQAPYPMYLVRDQARRAYDAALKLTYQRPAGTLATLTEEGDLVKKIHATKKEPVPVSVHEIRKITREALDRIVKLKGPASSELPHSAS